MARYRVMAWRDIPSQVKATDEAGATATRMLPNRWQQEIDKVAMAEELTGTDEYLELWAWGPELERPGTAEEVAEAVLAELVAAGLPASAG
ncbi:MAG: virulence factor [Chloroflexota bacterium]